MSSRVLVAGAAAGAARFAWKEVPRGKAAGPSGAAAIAANPDAAAEGVERRTAQLLQEARAAGYREGEEAGRKRAAAELEPALERLARSIQEIAGLRAGLRREAEADMLQLALAIARRVLHREMALDPDAVHGLVLAALEKLQGQDISRVSLHPSHAALVGGMLRKSGVGQGVEVVADPGCQPGSVVFETARGSLDASVDTQLREIERGLADCLRRHA